MSSDSSRLPTTYTQFISRAGSSSCQWVLTVSPSSSPFSLLGTHHSQMTYWSLLIDGLLASSNVLHTITAQSFSNTEYFSAAYRMRSGQPGTHLHPGWPLRFDIPTKQILWLHWKTQCCPNVHHTFQTLLLCWCDSLFLECLTHLPDDSTPSFLRSSLTFSK